MAITVDTKMIALLGTPLGQSFSPRMQNEAYASMGFNAHYFPVECDNEHIGDIINAIRYMNFAGFAVTKPNKEYAVQFMDEMDPLAEKMGTINTVVKTGTTLKGYNTDGFGATKSLELEGVKFEESTFFVWGAGGTGKSVCFTMANLGAKKMYISSRSDKCEKLAADLNDKFGREVAVAIRTADEDAVKAAVAESDVLMNLSGLGMRGHEGETPIAAECIKPTHVCFDATYNPLKTQFLLDAEAKGCKIINGLGMVIYQGARQIELWAGVDEAPVDQMFKTINDIVAGK
ncbi:MAG: shikimate dehydrogenase [Lachnospiraceae bacterium]|nr:shikimate dehydrogenase [Lachnospiraceae bacterium]MCD8124303.1 shikimate dehydrogenase [Lachnospiraceae bacterium]